MKEKKPQALDIFAVLAEVDARNFGYYASLTEEQRKSVAPYVIMRWMSSVSNNSTLKEYYLTTVNDIVNVGFWDLAKHPELQWMLLAVCGSGVKVRHQWVPFGKKEATTKVDKLLLSLHPSLNDLELEIVKSKLTLDSVRDLCRGLGMPDDEIKSYTENFKKYLEKSN